MPPDSLTRRLAGIRRKARWLLWLNGLSLLAAVLIGAAVMVGMLDWLLHIDDSGLRLILGLSILAAAGWVAWRYLVAPLASRLSDIEIALRIEQRYPQFNDSLASTVQFLQQRSDPKIGSPELQERVIEETIAQVERVDVDDVFETTSVRKSVLAAVAVCLFCGALVGLNRTNAGIALNRLMYPFSNKPWPRKTELRFVDTDFEPVRFQADRRLRMARGDRLELFVENVKGELPDDVTMEYVLDGQERTSERLRPSVLRDAQGKAREFCAATLTAVAGPFKFRAVGGDDETMRWIELDVVPPPSIDSLRVTLTPPGYSGQERHTLRENTGHVQGLVGTKIEISGKATKPLQSAVLQVKDREAQPLPLTEDGLRFEASFHIEEASVAAYWFQLTDREGFRNANPQHYEIRGIEDAVPLVTIVEPPTDLQVTADADVPLQIAAKDDVGLTGVSLHYRFLVDTNNESPASFPLPLEAVGLQQAELTGNWRMSELPLAAGMRIVFHAQATDAYDLGSPHVGKSQERTLTVVTAGEKIREIASRQGGLLEELQNILKMQTRAHSQVGELQMQLETVGRLESDDVDLLKRVEVDQRQISARLFHPVDGIESQVARLVEDFDQNKLTDEPTEQRMLFISDELTAIRTEHLPNIEQHLTAARKLAGSPGTHGDVKHDSSQQPAAKNKSGPEPPQETRGEKSSNSTPSLRPDKRGKEQKRANGSDRSNNDVTVTDLGDSNDAIGMLGKTREHQAAVRESLEEIVDRLSRWRNQRDLIENLEEIVADQTDINRSTTEIGSRTLSKSFAELTPQQRADLNRLAIRQRSLAARYEQFRDKLEEMAKRPRDARTTAFGSIEEANELADQHSTGRNMRDAADRFERNQVGQAMSEQSQALEELAELGDTLRNRRGSDPASRMERLVKTADDLEMLRKEQEQLRREVAESDTDTAGRNEQHGDRESSRLAEQQQRLRKQADELVRRLRRLRAQSAGNAARRGASNMLQAEEQIGQRQLRDAAKNQQQALDDLEQAQRELAQELRRAEQELARELLEQIADILPGLAARQQNLIDETSRLEQLRIKRGNWSRGQLISLRDLTRQQEQLKAETDSLVEQVAAAEVFALALKGAVRNMATAAARLAQRMTDQPTIAAEQSARKRLLDLVDALKPPSREEAQQSQPGGGDSERQSAAPSDAIPPLAQLRLLKTLQEDLIQRTAELDRAFAEEGSLTEAQLAEMEQLSLEQGELADLVRNLTARASAAGPESGQDVDSIESDELDEDGNGVR